MKKLSPLSANFKKFENNEIKFMNHILGGEWVKTGYTRNGDCQLGYWNDKYHQDYDWTHVNGVNKGEDAVSKCRYTFYNECQEIKW